MRNLLPGIVVMILGVGLAGCISLPGTTLPPEEAILAGSWGLTGDAVQNLDSLVFTFDDRGDLSLIVFQISGTQRLTDTNPRGDVTVSGSTVTIDTTILGSGTIFTGTLNADNTQIVGTLTTRLQIGSIVAETDQGAVTFTRQ
jgi:hypothetical protein